MPVLSFVFSGRHTAPVLSGRHTAPVLSGRHTAPVFSGRHTAPVFFGVLPKELLANAGYYLRMYFVVIKYRQIKVFVEDEWDPGTNRAMRVS